jgi:hypothetical protein
MLTNTQRIAQQIDHFAICTPFRACLRDVRCRRAAETGFERDHYMMINDVQLKTTAAIKVKKLYRPIKYHTSRLKDTAV